MGLRDKVINALQKSLKPEYIRLEDDDGISGYVVSNQFEKMSTLDRQHLIDRALRSADDPMTEQEQRQILMIAGLTPLEYESVGSRIRVHEIKVLPDGSLEILLHGGYSDAMYVRGALNNQKGVCVTEPELSTDDIGTLMTFRARGTDSAPLSKEKAIAVLVADPYIQVLQSA